MNMEVGTLHMDMHIRTTNLNRFRRESGRFPLVLSFSSKTKGVPQGRNFTHVDGWCQPVQWLDYLQRRGGLLLKTIRLPSWRLSYITLLSRLLESPNSPRLTHNVFEREI